MHAHTLTRLLNGSTHETQAFPLNYGKPQKVPTNTSPKTVSIPTLTFDTIPIKIVLMKIATEIW